MNTIILASSILYELVGPVCAKLSLYLSGSYSDKIESIVDVKETDESGKKKSEVDILIERINKIQEELPPHAVIEDEMEFTNAAEEHLQNQYNFSRFGRFRRR